MPEGKSSAQSTPWEGATSPDDCYATDQCIAKQHNCDEHATCVDLPDIDDVPSYTCKCQLGYEGNGYKGQCRSICENFCQNDAECWVGTAGVPECRCKVRGLLRCFYN